ncbi:type II toxin-antitoxin system RelE/ParE family toxin [Candidatus Woesearchaeota archaeon]|nr:type II toxin-antitoxin system RelE/ParE family toxin [Candidatus Woesearchaeota archaeon]
MYEIEFSKTAEKQLYKLDREAQSRIISTLERIRIRPYPFVKRLVDSQYFRLRAGDYRIILDIQDNKLLIFVIELDHRKSIYK